MSLGKIWQAISALVSCRQTNDMNECVSLARKDEEIRSVFEGICLEGSRKACDGPIDQAKDRGKSFRSGEHLACEVVIESYVCDQGGSGRTVSEEQLPYANAVVCTEFVGADFRGGLACISHGGPLRIQCALFKDKESGKTKMECPTVGWEIWD